MLLMQESKNLLDQREVAEQGGEGVGYGGHGLDEDVQRDAYHVLAGITDRIAHHGSLMGGRTLAVAFQRAGFYILLGIVETKSLQ